MKRETDHVVLRDGTAVCLHCSEEYKIGLPCPTRMLVAIANTFLDMHRHCLPLQRDCLPAPKQQGTPS